MLSRFLLRTTTSAGWRRKLGTMIVSHTKSLEGHLVLFNVLPESKRSSKANNHTREFCILISHAIFFYIFGDVSPHIRGKGMVQRIGFRRKYCKKNTCSQWGERCEHSHAMAGGSGEYATNSDSIIYLYIFNNALRETELP